MGITINRGTVMGQYHLTVNLDKKEFLLPHKFGVGLKLREQFGVHYGVQDALLMLLACSNGYGGGDFLNGPGTYPNEMIGRWAGDRVVVIGDYATADDLPMMWDAKNIYLLCHNYGDECGGDGCTADVSRHYLDISDMIIPVMMANDGGFILDVKENGWRSRQRMAAMQDDMVSMDDILHGGLSTSG